MSVAEDFGTEVAIEEDMIKALKGAEWFASLGEDAFAEGVREKHIANLKAVIVKAQILGGRVRELDAEDFGTEAALGELREKVEAALVALERIEGRLEAVEATLGLLAASYSLTDGPPIPTRTVTG